MSNQNEIPDPILRLGEKRAAARAKKDWVQSDAIRDELKNLGWEILDTPAGFEFRPWQRFPVVQRISELQEIAHGAFRVTVGVIVDDFCEDAAQNIRELKKHSPSTIAIAILVRGEPNLFELPDLIDDRTFLYQISSDPGWGEVANAILKRSSSEFVTIMDPSTKVVGDLWPKIFDAFESGEWSAVGWRGGLVNLDDDWRSITSVDDGEVDVLFSYFLVVKREDALGAGGFSSRAIYYRNADIEFSLRLRQVKGRLLQRELPLQQERHHGYFDVDPTFRDEQSKRNYDRILERFRGKTEILSPRR